jgi:hypothetical protein
MMGCADNNFVYLFEVEMSYYLQEDDMLVVKIVRYVLINDLNYSYQDLKELKICLRDQTV